MCKYLRIFFFATACILLIHPPAFAQKDTLTVASHVNVRTMDPIGTSDTMPHVLIFQINECLVWLGKDNKVEPLLAERWEMLPDKVSVKFYLKKGVKFHNGEIMTADDVVYSFKRTLSPAASPIRNSSAILADAEKVDDYTVILKANMPVGEPFLLTLCHPWASIVNAKATEAAGQNYSQNPVGTGRFKFHSWIIADRLTLDRFDEYHGEKAKLKRMVFRILPEASIRTIELESGAVDVILDTAPADIPRIRDNPNLRVFQTPSVRTYYMGMDVTKPPYDNLKVRQAFSFAVNREGLAKVAFRGFAQPSRGMVTSAIPYNKYDVSPPLKRDIARAKALLAEAGFPNGFKMRLLISDRSEHASLATILQANFKEIGVDMQIDTIEYAAYLGVILQKDHEPYLQNWWGSPPATDPYFLYSPFHSSAIGGSNRMFYRDPEVDKLLDAGMSLFNGPEREAVYGKLWDTLNQTLPWIPLIQLDQVFSYHKSLKGINYPPGPLTYLGAAYFDE